MKSLFPLIIALGTSLTLAPAGAASAADKADAAGLEFFERKIRPVLVEHCYECHSADAEEAKGGLLLDSRQATRSGGESGPAVVPNEPGESLLLEALKHESFEMPPERRLPDAIIADFEKWIQLGAPDPRDGETRPETKAGIDIDAGREFWAFQKPQRHDAPPVKKTNWSRRPLDTFVLARQEAAGLSPNDRAEKRTLIRRLYLTVHGLPPTPEQVDAFLADDSPTAWNNQVEEVLAAPQYGERLARMWLDVARYAEDQAHIVGNNRSLCYPNAWMYRDWVIEALNADIAYDEFIRLQLAADQFAADDKDVQIALGFLGLGPKYYRRGDAEVMADEWESQIDTVMRGLQGLTVGCARCHDHKFDPIPTTDYYSLAGIFASTEMFNEPLDDSKEKNKNGHAKKPEESRHIVRDKNPHDIEVQIRGNVKTKGPVVERAFLSVLSPTERTHFNAGSGRKQLAESIASRDNPLTARVIVNRVWAILIGQPLVGTPSNFGALGEDPTHPQLLDDLSVQFMDNGWSLKWLYREILLSATWQQSSDIDAAKNNVDPANKLLWRTNRRRLDVESWRDSILEVAGRLDRTVGGESIDPQEPEQTRRSVYAEISRLDLNPMLARFDFPDPNAHSAKRVETTTPLQKMFVLNSPFMVRQAKALSQRVQSSGENVDDQVLAAWRIVFSRDPDEQESALATAYLGKADDSRDERWNQFAQILLASNELLIVD
ncbi:MAG: PSD1 and planctomycete cytochrome C domain-containing protein [Planctomycetota bacterium]|jgi:mono/diheme cytochrome c family protein